MPSIIEAWFSASEKIAIFSSSAGFLPTAKRELMLPRAVITAMSAENPVGQRRQSSFFFNFASDSSTSLW
uniref:Cl1004_1 n=1 Tax=Arundo donax TaxID=35708 RepID=A0A0A9EM64_ARUDO